jgi:hypothetical protein
VQSAGTRWPRRQVRKAGLYRRAHN